MPDTLLQRDRALASWRQWQPAPVAPPEVVRELDGGLTNRAWLVRAGARYGVVRVNSPWDRELNIDRRREHHIHATVARFGAAPAVWHCDPGYRFLVTEFIQGRVWNRNDFNDVGKRRALFALMAQFDELEWPLPRFDYWLHLLHYRSCLEAMDVAVPAGLRYALEHHDDEIQAFQLASWQPRLVHHDLEPANIIESDGRLYIIDWEYAGLGCRDMDFPDFPLDEPAAAVVPLLSRLINDCWYLLREQLAPQEK